MDTDVPLSASLLLLGTAHADGLSQHDARGEECSERSSSVVSGPHSPTHQRIPFLVSGSRASSSAVDMSPVRRAAEGHRRRRSRSRSRSPSRSRSRSNSPGAGYGRPRRRQAFDLPAPPQHGRADEDLEAEEDGDGDDNQYQFTFTDLDHLDRRLKPEVFGYRLHSGKGQKSVEQLFNEASRDADPNTLEEDHRNDNPDFCFLCYANLDPRAVENHPGLSGLVNYARAHYLNIRDDMFAASVQLIYNKFLRSRVNEPPSRKIWKRGTIIAHFRDHTCDTLFETRRKVKRLTTMMNVAQASILQVNRKGHMILNNNSTRIMLQLMKCHKLYSEQEAKLMGSSSSKAAAAPA